MAKTQNNFQIYVLKHIEVFINKLILKKQAANKRDYET